GSSYILSPLSIDGSAITLYLDALDPDVASEGGTALAAALRQGGELLRAGSELADRVLVVFTDGEAHDTLPEILAPAERLRAAALLLAQATARRTAALVGIALVCGVPGPVHGQGSSRRRSAAERAWDRHDVVRARAAYLAELAGRRRDDTAWYNAGTAALASGDFDTAQATLSHAAASLDPDVRFR